MLYALCCLYAIDSLDLPLVTCWPLSNQHGTWAIWSTYLHMWTGMGGTQTRNHVWHTLHYTLIAGSYFVLLHYFVQFTLSERISYQCRRHHPLTPVDICVRVSGASKTRMHSSRIRTVRSSSRLCSRGGVPAGGCTRSRGVYPTKGAYPPRGAYLPRRGVAAWGVYLPGGFLPRYSSLWTEWQTGVKT